MDSTFINEILVALKCGTTSILYRYISLLVEMQRCTLYFEMIIVIHLYMLSMHKNIYTDYRVSQENALYGFVGKTL